MHTITGQGTTWYVVNAANGLIKSEHASRAEAEAALGIKPAAPEPRGCYRIRRGVAANGVHVYTAEYITHNGEVRYLTHAAIIDPVAALINKLTGAMAALKMADGLSEGAQLGASVSKRERDKIAELVAESISAGAELKLGGVIPASDGAFYPATVLSVAKDNPILQHEVFGPVAPVVTFESDAEAIELANDSEYGLIAYIYSGDLKRAIRTAEAIEAGMVAINRGVISDPAAPFGGVKQSGLGREGGFAGIHEFLETKYIGVEI